MAAKDIEKVLRRSLLGKGKMHYELYRYELEELLEDMKSSLVEDNDDYLFSVTENSGHVAMVLIEKSGEVHINEQAREKLKSLWPAADRSNIEKLLPTLASQLDKGEIPINGVKIV
jgi:gamma-glutamyl:cysteine ligase YbdK (ATP-grasp superfamily)